MVESNWQDFIHRIQRQLIGINVSVKGLITTSIGLAVGVYVAYIVIYGLYFCPTRHIPGPILTRFTSIPFNILQLSGQQAFSIHKQHQKYGLQLPPIGI